MFNPFKFFLTIVTIFILGGMTTLYAKPVKHHTSTAVKLAAEHTSRGSNESPGNIASSYKVFGKRYYVLSSNKNFTQTGLASWYGPQFNGRQTSSGERFNMYSLTAAHKSLPLDTYVLVKNLNNGKSVVVKINDRGPFVSNRIIDLSYAAAKQIGMVGSGVAPVSVQTIRA